MMKKGIVTGLVVLAVILSGCGESAEETATPEVEMEFVPVVSVTGEVIPAVWANVSVQTGGTVVEVLVEPGDEVAAGDLLARLDPTDAQLAVQQAEAAVEAAQAQLALLKADPSPEQIAVSEAQVAAAQTVISQTIAQRNQLWSGATEAEIAAAQAQVAAAQAEQWMAREAHDQTLKCYTMPNGSEVCPALGPPEEQARHVLHAADEALAAAQAQLDALKAGSYLQVRTADAAVAAAEAQTNVAQAQLGLLQARATGEEIAVAEAAVTQAETALEIAHVALGRCEVRAPFAGTAGAVNVRVGELVAPGQPLVTLGDLTTLRVETTDLDETQVARVEVGQQAATTFDALPERVFTGQVTRISPMAEPGAGGVNYTVILELETDSAIQWGMTAFVDIEIER
ncbi:MAG: HlyD family efflux transporter periplasmic adaptor subunit [Chloroflexota bacterium]|nr:HlyD family efflux transporter periplasmic adaptor subunit [Chloroflexota bacterium]